VGFVAPEVVKKEEHTTGMDVFSVGIMIYMMFNCKKPCITDE
jgi:serine/threonine protein kinase